MTKRKKPVLKNISTETFNEALSRYATADAKLNQITAKMDAEMTKVREKYADQLSAQNAITEETFDIVQVYCEEHPEFFSDKKSMETPHGTVGFRTGTPKLKLRKGFTWPAVTELLKRIMPDYVRTVEEPNKEKLLSDRTTDIAIQFPSIGVMVDQDESFYIALKKEESEVSS